MLMIFREAISKPQIAFDGKARTDEKAQHTWEYVSILNRCSTQPSGARWGLEMASKNVIENLYPHVEYLAVRTCYNQDAGQVHCAVGMEEMVLSWTR